MTGAYSYFTTGAAQYPLTVSASANSLLAAADPALDGVIKYYEWAIEQYAAVALVTVATNIGAPIAKGVKQAIPCDPAPYLAEQQYQPPLLAVFRTAGKLSDKTINWKQNEGAWTVGYVLPPLTSGQLEALVPILKAVVDVLDSRTEQKGDPDYTPPGQAQGADPFLAVGIQTIRVVDVVYGKFDAAADLTFPMALITLAVTEQTMTDSRGLANFTSATASLSDGSVDPLNPVDLVNIETDLP